MNRSSASALVLMLLTTTVLPLAAQQSNTPSAALSINGTGRLDDMGALIPSSSQVTPPPAGSAALHHRLSPGTSLELRIDGPPLSPIILVSGTPAPSTPVGAYSFDLDLNTAQVLLDGLSPTNLLDYGSFTDFTGTWRFYLPQGLPPQLLDFSLQGLIYDPATPPISLRFTSAITVSMDPGIETLARNLVDGLNIVADNPQLLASTLSSSFMFQGLDAAQFVVLQAAEEVGFGDEGSSFDIFEGVGHDNTPAVAVPTTLPTAGQTFPAYLQILGYFDDNPCPPGINSAERFRATGLLFVEQGGIWRLDGDQRDALVETGLAFISGSSNAQGIDVHMDFVVEDSIGRNGGISSVSVTGPQLASISFNDVALSATSGTQNMFLTDGGPEASCWDLVVQIADTTIGSSRMPRIISNASPDMYTISISWNDGSPQSSYVVGLRSSIDVDTNPAGVLAALPATASAPSAVLNMAGTANATIDLTFQVGSLTGTPDFGHLSVEIYQAGGGAELEELFPNYAPNSTQTMNVCAPFFTPGAASYFIDVNDFYGSNYVGAATIGL